MVAYRNIYEWIRQTEIEQTQKFCCSQSINQYEEYSRDEVTNERVVYLGRLIAGQFRSVEFSSVQVLWTRLYYWMVVDRRHRLDRYAR